MVMFEDVRIERSSIRPELLDTVLAKDLKPGMLISNGIVAVWVESASTPMCRFRYTYAGVAAETFTTRFKHSVGIALVSHSYKHDDEFYCLWNPYDADKSGV